MLAFVKLPVIVRRELRCEASFLFFYLFQKSFFFAAAHSPFLFLLFFLFSNPADDPSHSVDTGGGGVMTCDAFVLHLGFTNTPKCTADLISTEDQTPWKTMTNHVAADFGCCGASKKSACWEDVSAGVCKTASDCT